MFEADSVKITVLVENWVDMLLEDQHSDHGEHCVRNGLIEHFDQGRIPPQAENGLSILVTAKRGIHTKTILFDAGLTGTVLLHNLRALRIGVEDIDGVVISHGHPDHFGGILPLLDIFDRTMPVMTHPDAFLPRFAVMADGRVSQYYNQGFTAESLERHGGRPILNNGALDLGCGIYTTGFIPRTVSFEGPQPPAHDHAPGLYQVAANGHYGLDEVLDEQGLVINVKGKGLIVITGCAHAGVLNTIDRAREMFGERPILAAIGGFHLGFPTTPEANVDRTLQGMLERDVKRVVPMHCSGLRTHVRFSLDAPEQYIQPSVGTVMSF
ncbi:MBL fold metallo-hydrolase [Arthrobacter sp. SD76]|uniref:MBL fold metallo-hydrolase n=1 Tax=Arthrobacter sp. SD76 TaxID=3415007 RepID=UPI003C773AC3